jgi:hypothetical protein
MLFEKKERSHLIVISWDGSIIPLSVFRKATSPTIPGTSKIHRVPICL